MKNQLKYQKKNKLDFIEKKINIKNLQKNLTLI